jgi:hypothetical protein
MRCQKGEKQDGRHGNTPKRFLVQNWNFIDFTVKIGVETKLFFESAFNKIC